MHCHVSRLFMERQIHDGISLVFLILLLSQSETDLLIIPVFPKLLFTGHQPSVRS